MDIRIFRQCRGVDNWILDLRHAPNFFISWMSGNRAVDGRNRFPCAEDISRFLDRFYPWVKENGFFDVSQIFPGFFDRQYSNHYAHFLRDAVNGLKGLQDRNFLDALSWWKLIEPQQEIENVGFVTPYKETKEFDGTIWGIRCRNQDFGYGQPRRYQHRAEYFLDMIVRWDGFPIEESEGVFMDEEYIEIRRYFIEAYQIQRVSDKYLKMWRERNIGRRISASVSYTTNVNGWKWNPYTRITNDFWRQINWYW